MRIANGRALGRLGLVAVAALTLSACGNGYSTGDAEAQKDVVMSNAKSEQAVATTTTLPAPVPAPETEVLGTVVTRDGLQWRTEARTEVQEVQGKRVEVPVKVSVPYVAAAPLPPTPPPTTPVTVAVQQDIPATTSAPVAPAPTTTVAAPAVQTTLPAQTTTSTQPPAPSTSTTTSTTITTTTITSTTIMTTTTSPEPALILGTPCKKIGDTELDADGSKRTCLNTGGPGTNGPLQWGNWDNPYPPPGYVFVPCSRYQPENLPEVCKP